MNGAGGEAEQGGGWTRELLGAAPAGSSRRRVGAWGSYGATSGRRWLEGERIRARRDGCCRCWWRRRCAAGGGETRAGVDLGAVVELGGEEPEHTAMAEKQGGGSRRRRTAGGEELGRRRFGGEESAAIAEVEEHGTGSAGGLLGEERNGL